MKKIVAFTAIRSEYDLLSQLYILLSKESDIEFKLIVSGAHLSEDHGYTVSDIENDGLSILAKIETLDGKNTKRSRIKSGANLLKKAIDVIANYKPDLILYAGDREEVIMASIIGGYLEIPTIHFFGGDHVSDSHIDNPVRHATSKLSTIHMVSSQEHYDRLYKMGEAKERIFNIGSIALDKFVNRSFGSIEFVKKKFDIKKGFDDFALLIFHSIPKERDQSGEIFENILLSLIENKIYTFVSYPNIDPGNATIIKVIDKFKGHSNFIFYKNQPREVFVSIYKNSKFIIGNSSSGILESASIPIPAINVGYRQTGRKANENVLFVGTTKEEINTAIEKACNKKFIDTVNNINSIFGSGDSANKALDLIKNKDFNSLIFKDEDVLKQQ